VEPPAVLLGQRRVVLEGERVTKDEFVLGTRVSQRFPFIAQRGIEAVGGDLLQPAVNHTKHVDSPDAKRAALKIAKADGFVHTALRGWVERRMRSEFAGIWMDSEKWFRIFVVGLQ
jgi:hypothetical protein